MEILDKRLRFLHSQMKEFIEKGEIKDMQLHATFKHMEDIYPNATKGMQT